MTAIRPARRQDSEAIADLLDELDQFYGGSATEPREVRIAGIELALFTSPPAVSALLAWVESSLIGLAAFSFLWPAAGVSRSLYLKELYVTRRSRRRGVGRLLMEEIFRIARENNCSRVEWTTEVGNVGAQQFYSTLGAMRQDEKLFYRMTT